MKTLPIAIENFSDMIRKDCYYVDKTSFIKTVMEAGCKVQLITRPRRFGKTLFMETLKSFLQIHFQKPGSTEHNASLFEGLKVSECPEFCRKYLGQYPVIFLSLKGVEGRDYAVAYRQFAEKLSMTAAPYAFLQNSPRLSDEEKTTLGNYLSKRYMKDLAHEDDCKSFLKDMTAWLSKHFERQVVVLIDEYDVPLAKAAQFGYYTDMLSLVRAFLGGVLKEDPQPEADASAYLRKAVLTGCLRVSKESVFTDVNNFDVNTVCSDDRTLNEAVGFNTEEVSNLLAYYGLSSRLSDVKHWYDGYRLAGSEIYCPWDVINFADKAIRSGNPASFPPGNYWEGTSGNDVIEEFLGFLTADDADKMQTLVDGGSVPVTVNEKLTYRDFADHRSDDFWSLLLFTGYLTVTESAEVAGTYRVKIPNEEIRNTFDRKIKSVYSKSNRQYARYGERLAEAFLSGDADAVRKVLMPLLRRYVSVRDEATKAPPENYYHGFLSAMLVCAGDRVANLHSNAEAGNGFADLVFTSEDLTIGAVIELKRCAKPEDMPRAAQDGLEQIQAKNYVQVFDPYQCAHCYGFSIAFSKKLCIVKAEQLSQI